MTCHKRLYYVHSGTCSLNGDAEKVHLTLALPRNRQSPTLSVVATSYRTAGSTPFNTMRDRIVVGCFGYVVGDTPSRLHSKRITTCMYKWHHQPNRAAILHGLLSCWLGRSASATHFHRHILRNCITGCADEKAAEACLQREFPLSAESKALYLVSRRTYWVGSTDVHASVQIDSTCSAKALPSCSL